MDMSDLKKIIREHLNELGQTNHSLDRLKERLLGIKNEIKDNHFNIVMQSLNQVENIEFPKDKSYAINLGPIMAKDSSNSNLVNVEGRIYYRVMGDSDGVLTDSTGNQFWIIVRGNNITTAMLRKDIQTRDMNKNKLRLKVDMVFNRVDHIKRL